MNKLSPEESAKRAADWAAAAPIVSPEEIIGTWSANASDMPDGSTIVEWKRTFGTDGDLTESIATETEATAPILPYRVVRSKLYVSESQEVTVKEQAELRFRDGKLLVKTAEGMYIFHRQK